MPNTADMVIAIALAEVGYLEKETPDLKYLYDKTANAGYNNYTKYAYELDNLPGFYNGKKNGHPYCDCFVDWCFVKAFGEETARQLLCQPRKSLGAGVQYSYGYYKAAGRFSKTPYVGDQIFFSSASYSYAHTGIVYKVDASRVYTVEGNASGASGVTPNGGGVVRKSYLKTYKYIIGYGHPDYDEAAPVPADPVDHQAVREMQTALNAAYKCGLTVDGILGAKTKAAVNAHLIKYGKTGKYVKWAQQRLTDIGFKGKMLKPDGIFGSRTKAAVIAFQRSRKIGADGIIGWDTVTQLTLKP